MIELLGCMVLAAAMTPPAKNPYSFRGLGDLPEGDTWSQAYAVSGDGKVVVGTGYGKFGREGFVWTAKDGMRSIGKLKPIDSYSEARAISSDGSVVVGFSKDVYSEVAVVWTAEGGLRALPRIAGDRSSRAVGVTSGGVIILGTATIPILRVNWTAESTEFAAHSVQRRGGLQTLSITAGTNAGWVLRRGGEPVHYDVGVKPYEFFQTAQSWAGGLVTWLKYWFGSGPKQMVEAEGPGDRIGCAVLGDVLPTAISENGAVICGNYAVRKISPGVSLIATPFSPGDGADMRDGTDPTVGIWREGFIQVGGEIILLPKDRDQRGRVRGYPNPLAISASGMDVVGWVDCNGTPVPARWKAVSAASDSAAPRSQPSQASSGSSSDGGVTAYEMLVQSSIKSADGENKLGRSSGLGGGHFWAVSADGLVVAGDAMKWGFWQAAAIGAGGEFGSLQDILKARCPNEVEGWRLLCARGISKDGRTIVGYGFNPQGRMEAWIATLDDPRKPYEELIGKKQGSPAADEPEDDRKE